MSPADEEEAFESDASIDAVAARWFVALHEAKSEDVAAVRQRFELWLSNDARHGEAFARASATWERIEAIEGIAEIDTLRRDLRAQLQRFQAGPSRTQRRAMAGGLAMATAIAAAGAWFFLWPAGPTVFSTGLGERRTVQLEDRSSVELDAESEITVSFTPQQRTVRVLHGQAYFQVAHNRKQPFVVQCNGRSVVATGTAFDVEALAQGLAVTLVEGHVVVKASERPDASILAKLDPGDSLITETGSASRLDHGANTLTLLAWRTGHLVFDNLPLAEAVARMERYSGWKVRVDPQVAAFRVSGVFVSDDMNGLLGAVEAIYPVSARPESDGTVRLVLQR